MNLTDSLRVVAIGLVAMILVDVVVSILFPWMAMSWNTRLLLYLLWPAFTLLGLRFNRSRDRSGER